MPPPGTVGASPCPALFKSTASTIAATMATMAKGCQRFRSVAMGSGLYEVAGRCKGRRSAYAGPGIFEHRAGGRTAASLYARSPMP